VAYSADLHRFNSVLRHFERFPTEDFLVRENRLSRATVLIFSSFYYFLVSMLVAPSAFGHLTTSTIVSVSIVPSGDAPK
jgi:hypothetical protein